MDNGYLKIPGMQYMKEENVSLERTSLNKGKKQ